MFTLMIAFYREIRRIVSFTQCLWVMCDHPLEPRKQQTFVEKNRVFLRNHLKSIRSVFHRSIFSVVAICHDSISKSA